MRQRSGEVGQPETAGTEGMGQTVSPPSSCQSLGWKEHCCPPAVTTSSPGRDHERKYLAETRGLIGVVSDVEITSRAKKEPLLSGMAWQLMDTYLTFKCLCDALVEQPASQSPKAKPAPGSVLYPYSFFSYFSFPLPYSASYRSILPFTPSCGSLDPQGWWILPSWWE